VGSHFEKKEKERKRDEMSGYIALSCADILWAGKLNEDRLSDDRRDIVIAHASGDISGSARWRGELSGQVDNRTRMREVGTPYHYFSFNFLP